MTRDIYPIFIFLPDLFKPNADRTITEAVILADAARDKGLDVGVIIDYFMRDPYHGCPPHVDPDTGGIVKSKAARARGLGYYPFSWIEGWVKAQAAVSGIMDNIRPDYIQQGVNASELNWKYVLPTNHLYRGYNDTMGLFKHASNDMGGWQGTYVVSGWYSKTLKKARELFGSVMTDSDFLNRCTLDMPDDDDDVVTPPPPPADVTLTDRVIMLEVVTAKIINLLSVIKRELATWEVAK